MTQTRRDDKLKRVLGDRLKELVDLHLAIGWDELATRLGYANSSTLRQAREGESLLSVEKLARLALVTTADGRKVSVDWLLTGLGSPLEPGALQGGRPTPETTHNPALQTPRARRSASR